MRRLVLLGLMALAACHDHQSDVDENLTTPAGWTSEQIADAEKHGRPWGDAPYMVFCSPKDPNGEPALAQTMEWYSTKQLRKMAGKDYKKCEEQGAI